MTGRRAVCILSALIALAVSAFGAQGSLAATKGTTAFTCRNVGGASQQFVDAHCKEALGGGNFAHIAVAEGTRTEAAVTNEKTNGGTTEASPFRFKLSIAGSTYEFSATGAHGEGFVTNSKGASGEHFAHGTGSIEFTGVTMTKPTGFGCKVYADEAKVEGKEGVVDSKLLKATTQEQGDAVKFEADEGNVLATFFLTCNPEFPEALQGTWEVIGSIKGVPSGATINFNHTEGTTQNTLKAKGFKVGIEGSLTASGLDVAGGDLQYTPLSATTIETP